MAEESHHHEPGLPTVHDESGDTPMWLPIVGLLLLVLTLLTTVWREARSASEEVAPPPELEAPAEPAPAANPVEAH